MFKFLNLQPEIFGMDINDLSVKIAKLKRTHGGLNLVSSNEVDLKPGIVKEGIIQDQDALVKTITLACSKVKGEKLGTKYVILSLPEERSFSQIIQMPQMTQQELTKAVPFEAENYIPLAIDKVYLDFEVITPHRKVANTMHLDVLVNAMPKYIIDSYVVCAKAAGLVPCALEIESQAIARVLMENGKSQKPTAILDFGGDNASFIIFSGNALRFTASIPFSSKQLTIAIADVLGMKFGQAEELKIKNGLMGKKTKENDAAIRAMKASLFDFAEKIKKYISFYHGHSSHDYFPSDDNIEKIILCGGGANLKGLSEFLLNELKIPVELGNPFTNIASGAAKKQPVAYQKVLSLTTALGLAIRGATPTDT